MILFSPIWHLSVSHSRLAICWDTSCLWRDWFSCLCCPVMRALSILPLSIWAQGATDLGMFPTTLWETWRQSPTSSCLEMPHWYLFSLFYRDKWENSSARLTFSWTLSVSKISKLSHDWLSRSDWGWNEEAGIEFPYHLTLSKCFSPPQCWEIFFVEEGIVERLFCLIVLSLKYFSNLHRNCAF